MSIFMRNLEIDYSIDQLECIASINNRYTEAPMIHPTIRDVGCIGVAWLIECITKAIADHQISDDGERTCLVMLDKIKNAIAALRDDDPPLNVDGELASTCTRCAEHNRLNCGDCC